MGSNDKACEDVSRAASLIKSRQTTADSLLKHELDVRQQSCKHRATMAGKG